MERRLAGAQCGDAAAPRIAASAAPAARPMLPSGLRPLAVTFLELADRSAPILGQQALAYVQVERRIRPIANSCHQTVYHWIVVNVIDMPLEILVVANGVLPESPLP